MQVVRLSQLFLSMVLLAIFSMSLVSAAVPTTMPYQGFLTDSNGEPISATVALTFSLYTQSSAGVPIWQEAHPTVPVTAGFFQVELGDQVLLDDSLFDAPLFLGIAVDSDPEMAPRMRIGSVPFARATGLSLACNVGETNCNGVCADLQSDPNHCSACGLVCAPGESCLQGACANCTPQTFYMDADGDGSGNCGDSIQACQATGSYTAINCGDCNDSDPTTYPGAPEICNDGMDNNCNGLVDCDDPSCPGGGGSGLTFCSGSCVDLSSDISHCGTCSATCTGNQCAAPLCVGFSCALDGSGFNGASCDDSNACTVSDTCDGSGNCLGAPVICDDGNVCTTDACNNPGGCVFTPVADGTPCPAGSCSGGVCQ